MNKVIEYFKKIIGRNRSILDKSRFYDIDGRIDFLISSKLECDKTELSDELHICDDLGADELDVTELVMEVESEFNIIIQDGAFALTIGELKNYVRNSIEGLNSRVADDKLFFEDSGWFVLEKVSDKERADGRISAIKDLVENHYCILENEFVNPSKELINFILNYLSTEQNRDEKKIEKILINHFPIMRDALLRYTTLIKQDINLEINHQIILNDSAEMEKGYQEFLNFTTLIYKELYPNKTTRNIAIRNNYKILGNDIIAYFDNKSID